MAHKTQTTTSAYDTLIQLGERIEELKAENDKLRHELLTKNALPGDVVRNRVFRDCSLKAKSRLVEARLREELKIGFYAS